MTKSTTKRWFLLLQKCSNQQENLALPNHLQPSLFVPLPLPAPVHISLIVAKILYHDKRFCIISRYKKIIMIFRYYVTEFWKITHMGVHKLIRIFILSGLLIRAGQF